MRIEASSVPLEIRLLGPLEVLRDGVAVELAGRRERSVLALLASNAGAPVGVDRLFRFLWADDEPRTADKTLQTYLSRLRRALGGELGARREAGYALAVPRDAVDAVRFRDLLVRGRRMQQAGDDAGALATYRRALDEWRAEEPAAARAGPLRSPSATWRSCRNRARSATHWRRPRASTPSPAATPSRPPPRHSASGRCCWSSTTASTSCGRCAGTCTRCCRAART